jgi:mitogen-activated protein kinase 8 interacting protein 3
VPTQAIKRISKKPTDGESSGKPKLEESYENVETNLVMSGGHGYIDFRVGDTNSNESKLNDIKTDSNKPVINPNDRSHLIVWQC